jgi:probable rRNA maturation factor
MSTLPPVELDISVEAGPWNAQDQATVSRGVTIALTAAIADGCDDLAAAPMIEVSVILNDDANVRTLNRDYRGKDSPTNVLSFAQLDEGEDEIGVGFIDGMPMMLGDVVIAHETTLRESIRDERHFHDHLMHLVVHGVLHLVGYDHIEEDEALRMEELERRILASQGIPNPYEGPLDV